MWLIGGYGERRKLWPMGSKHVYRAACVWSQEIQHYQWTILDGYKQKRQFTRPHMLMFFGILCTTFNPSAWYDDSNVAHIKLCSQACLDAIPVNCHDDFALRPNAHDTVPGWTCWLWCSSVFTSQSEPEGAAHCLNLLCAHTHRS